MKRTLLMLITIFIISTSILSSAEQSKELTKFDAPFTNAALKNQTVDSISSSRTFGAAATIFLLTELFEKEQSSVSNYTQNMNSYKSFIIKESEERILLLLACDKTTTLEIYYYPATGEAFYFKGDYSSTSNKDINQIVTEIANSYDHYFENDPDDLKKTSEAIYDMF